MSDHPWNRPHDPLRPLREQIAHLDRPEPLPLMESPYRIEQAPAFAPEYAATIHEHARQITEWINGEVERGATDALVAALRDKGWTVTPPPLVSQSEPKRRIEQAIAYVEASWLGNGKPVRNTPAGEIIAILRGERTYERGDLL